MHSDSSKKKRVNRSEKSVRDTDEEETCGPSQPQNIETLPMEYPIPMDIPSTKPRGLKGKNIIFSPPIVADKVKPKRPFIRETTKQHVLMKDDTTETSIPKKGKSQSSK